MTNMMPDLPDRCKAIATGTGEQCRKAPLAGQSVCRSHGGASPIGKEAGRHRLLEARVATQLQKLGWDPVTDPVAAFADLAGEIWAFKELCREQVNKLDDWTSFNLQDEEFARAAVAVYERALDRANKTLVDMLRLNLDAAAIGAAKARPTLEQAEVLIRVLERVFNGLSLTDGQRAQTPNAVGQALRDEGLLPS